MKKVGGDTYDLIEKVDSIWMRENDCIIWNTDNNEEDLMDESGMTYSGYIAEGVTEYDDYLVCNLDTNTGTMITMFFDMKKEIKNG